VEDWQREDYEPSSARTRVESAIAERAEREDVLTREIVEQARRAGTLRVDSTVTVRKVDPATIRPPGWKPIVKVTDAPVPEKKLAILEALERGPRTQAAIRKMLGLGNDAARLFLQLIDEGKVWRTGESESVAGGAPSPVVALVEAEEPGRIASDAPEPPVAPESKPEVASQPAKDQNSHGSEDEPEPEEEDEVADLPERECALPTCKVRFTPYREEQIFHDVRCQEADAGQRRRGEPKVRTCRLEECTETFEPVSGNHWYHSDECRQIASRRQKAASKRASTKREKKEQRVTRDTATAAAAAKPPAEEGSATELRQRYVNLLFTAAEGDDCTDDILARLERVATDGNGLRTRYLGILVSRGHEDAIQRLDTDELLAYAEQVPAPVVLDVLESRL
jgi:hypothetical protein